ncbi:hypothetical protein NGUA41_04033 [Salmonella enterica]|nr:hypothetical protein NGUA40_00771 [Salmonella enterica]GAS79135.1 hypothetical protein NGUA41_04033 [Salmonella enterica]
MTLKKRIKILEAQIEKMKTATVKQVAESDISNGSIQRIVLID